MKRFDFIKGLKKIIKSKSSVDKVGENFIGIDWGSRTDLHAQDDPTVICVLTKLPDGQIHYKYEEIHQQDFRELTQQIEGFIDRLKPSNVVADIGFGQVQCQMLQRHYGDLVKSCYYSRRDDRFFYNQDIWMLTVDRDSFLAESGRLANGPMTDNERHALNYAYIASLTPTRRVNENPVRSL